MTNLQIDYQKMFMRVESAMQNFASTWQSNSIMVGCMKSLTQYLSDLTTLGAAQYIGTKGTTSDFNSRRSKLTDNAFLIKEALRLYYTFNAMDDEIKLYSFPKSRLIRERISEFYITVADISEKATALSGTLVGMGVSAQQIVALAKDVSDYYKKIIGMEKKKENRKGITATIPETIRNCRIMLKKRMDPCVNTFAGNANAKKMVDMYYHCRRLVRSGGKRNYYTVIFNGLVKDGESKQPLPNVTITPETKGKPAVTDQKGKFTLKVYKKYAKALNFELAGYIPRKFLLPPKRIKEHKMQVVVEMRKMKEIVME